MKKTLFTILLLASVIAFQSTSIVAKVQEEAGLGTVLFEDTKADAVAAQTFLINELSYKTIEIHMNIAGKNIETNDYEGETLATIKRLEELTKTDIVELLNISTDKQEALAKYLTECDQELQKGEIISTYMNQEMVLLKSDMQSCLVDKNISDKEYFDAIDRYDQSIMETSLMDSITYENCAAENRIQYNAKTGIARKLVFYLGVLQKKYDLLFAKQEVLAQNYQIFRDNILPDLNQIDQLLKQYQF